MAEGLDKGCPRGMKKLRVEELRVEREKGRMGTDFLCEELQQRNKGTKG
jgi:hypothetical protein